MTQAGKYYLIASIFVSASIGELTNYAFGWFVLGIFALAAAMAKYLDGPRHGKY